METGPDDADGSGGAGGGLLDGGTDAETETGGDTDGLRVIDTDTDTVGEADGRAGGGVVARARGVADDGRAVWSVTASIESAVSPAPTPPKSLSLSCSCSPTVLGR
ncbi:hypothetical protein [Actinoplanes sp. NBRC 101535]|uniref:hypothetical protein n=1 Tax=Actinoplanes sp. NBRC 101535 TaxID=3032196 RepID=UPI0024A35571|nr:hypothetical protein [Actinoplanes sp. NBRC 101535]GLY01334.1 hypothetical protein Acsp01_17130 [Actinoplanes sp. NBRC 101535]